MSNMPPVPDSAARSDTRGSRGGETWYGERRGLRLLVSLGLSMRAESAYLGVVQHGGFFELPLDIRQELAQAGLVRVEAGVVHLESAAQLVRTRAERDSAAARAAYEAALEMETLESGRSARIESTRSQERILNMFNHTIASAKEQFRGLDRPPHLTPSSGQAPTQPASIERGVIHRAIYEREVFQDPRLLETMRVSVQQGEQARVRPHVPVRLLIADEDLALTLRRDIGGAVVATQIREPVLVGMFGDLFEQLWETSVPVTPMGGVPGDDSEPTAVTQELLTLLSMGLTDNQIAAELGVSSRTVVRRITELSARLGVRGRFQLGLEAQRRGWLTEH